jgi:hypothetical protein
LRYDYVERREEDYTVSILGGREGLYVCGTKLRFQRLFGIGVDYFFYMDPTFSSYYETYSIKEPSIPETPPAENAYQHRATSYAV